MGSEPKAMLFSCPINGIGAKSNAFLLPNYLFREFFCVIKDKLMGNL